MVDMWHLCNWWGWHKSEVRFGHHWNDWMTSSDVRILKRNKADTCWLWLTTTGFPNDLPKQTLTDMQLPQTKTSVQKLWIILCIYHIAVYNSSWDFFIQAIGLTYNLKSPSLTCKFTFQTTCFSQYLTPKEKYVWQEYHILLVEHVRDIRVLDMCINISENGTQTSRIYYQSY